MAASVNPAMWAAWQASQQRAAAPTQANIPAVPQLQMPQMPQFNAQSSGSQNALFGIGGGGPAPQAQSVPQQNPQLQAIIQQLQQQASQSNSVLSDQANQQIAAQRAVMERQTGRNVTQSLAANGLLPTGGQSARLEQQLRAPMEEQLASFGANVNQNLQQQRTGTANNLLQQLTTLQGQERAGQFDQQRLGLDQQRAQWDMQMTQYNAQVRAAESAYQRSIDQWNRQQQQTQQQQLQQRQASQGGGYDAGGGGSMTGGVSGWNGGQNSFLSSGQQPRDTYNNSVNADRANQQRQYDIAMADRQNRQNSGMAGNGVSSAGSSTGVSMNGPLVSGQWRAPQSAQASQGYGVGGMYPTAYGGDFGNSATDNYMTGGWGA